MRAALPTSSRRVLLALLAAGATAAAAAAQPADREGPLAIDSSIYDFGDQAFDAQRFSGKIELKGKVTYPKGLPSGPYPLLVFLHGRHATCFSETDRRVRLQWPCPTGTKAIDSFLGYDYLAKFLASHGFIVVSVSANGINAADRLAFDHGTAARGQLLQRHLDLWRQFTTSGGAPFGTTFAGKVDLARIGTMGHSRGGEGVVFHYLQNKQEANPHAIKAVLALAPVNFRRLPISGVPFAAVLPYCDGDVTDLAGVHYYDDSRYSVPGDPAPKYYFLMMGANHNYFNTVWSPSSGVPDALDDWSDYEPARVNDPFCGKGPTSRRFSEQKQRRLGLLYMSLFFRLHVRGDQAFAAIVQGMAKASPDQRDDEVFIAYHAPDSLAYRLDLNRLDDGRYLRRNNAGGIVQFAQLETADMCGAGDQHTSSCLAQGEPFSRQPHTSPSDPLLAPAARGLNQLRLGWKEGSGRFVNELPQERADVSAYQSLQFRVGLNYTDPRNQSQGRDFSIRIVDLDGNAAAVRVGQYSRALSFPPGRSGPTPKVVLTTVRIPLSAFKTINFKRTKAVEFAFDSSPSGAILLSDLAFVGRR